MAEHPTKDRLTRRAALKTIAESAGVAASAAVGLPILGNAAAGAHCGSASVALNRDATAPRAAAFSPSFFDPSQMKTIAALAETIIPGDGHSPGARAASVHEYIDAIVANSSEDIKGLWRDGMVEIELLAKSGCGKSFADCTPEDQNGLLLRLSANEEHPVSVKDRFFIALKNATVEGYYTSAIGIHQELEYQGNRALAEFEGCTHPEHKDEAKR